MDKNNPEIERMWASYRVERLVADLRMRDVAMAGRGGRYFRAPFSFLDRTLDEFLLQNPAVSITNVSEVRCEDGDVCVKVAFDYAPDKDPTPAKYLSNGNVVLDPSLNWAIRSSEIQLSYPGVGGTVVTRLDYRPLQADRIPVIQRISAESTGPSGSLKEIIAFESLDLDSDTVDDITLAAYGFPGFDNQSRAFRIPPNVALFGLGALALTAAFILRRRASHA